MCTQLLKKILVSLLTWEAQIVLRIYRPKIIAVTGSVGKTATKDAIFAMMSTFTSVGKSAKSFNSELGVPLAVLGIEESGWRNPLIWIVHLVRGLTRILFRAPYPEWLVLEVGVDHPGDMVQIVSWITPNIAVFTRIGEVPVHVEFFPSREALIEEKSALIAALPQGGIAILNADDPDIAASGRKTAGTVITFGRAEGADISIQSPEIRYNDKGMPWGFSFKISHAGRPGEEMPAVVPITLLGTISLHYAYPLAAAFAVGSILTRDVPRGRIDLGQALMSFEVPPGRGKLIDGMNGSLVIDDTYNASPTAVEAALESLKATHVPGMKIAVLGDMLELGKDSFGEHRRIGARVASVVGRLVTVGVRAHAIAEEAVRQGLPAEYVRAFTRSDDAAAYMATVIGKGDIVLVKGSQSMRLEKLVRRIIARPEDALQLLVRQEPEWLKKH